MPCHILKGSKLAILTPILALILAGSVMQACKSTEVEIPPYHVEQKSYYHDLIIDIATHGKISLAHADKYPEKKDNKSIKPFIYSQDIRPVDMDGAKNFEAKNFDILMQISGTMTKELHLPGGKNRIIVQARGESSDGTKARMRVMVDETELGTVDVLPELNRYAFPAKLKKGPHQIRVSFLNGDENRKLIMSNIHVRRVVMDYPEFVQKFIVTRLQDDTLNEVKGAPFIIMGKIGSITRRSLFMPPPSRAEITLTVPENASLQFAAGIDEYVRRSNASSCTFRVFFLEDSTQHMLYEETFQPFKNKNKLEWSEVKIDLSKFQNKKGTLRFETEPLLFQGAEDNISLGYFLLANPRILVASSPKEPNIILISIDTLRRDHLGLYGYAKEVSPFLDTMASEAAVFDRAIAQAPYTVTSHMTMMTSLWPRVHQILTHEYQDRLSTKWLTLPQILKARGYRTAGFTGGGQLSAVYGFDRGMDVYDFEGGRTENIFPKAIKWMANARGNPFFLFLHTYDPHMPYEPPPPYDTIFNPGYEGNVSRWTDENVKITDPELFDRIVDLYDGEIRYVDSQIQRVFQFLKDVGLYANTMIIITSDHGEEFMEHGAMAYHSHTLYNELLLVPLIIKFPEGQWRGRTIRDPVALNDLMPTVLDYLELPLPSYNQGESLVTYLKRKTPPNTQRRIFSERIAIRDDPRVDVSIQTLSEKYYQKVVLSDEFFDLAKDPAEKNDLLASHKTKASQLLKGIREYFTSNTNLAKVGLESKGRRKQVMDEETVEKLKALGYIK
ncbi:sulfatase-like hydrolase/transferase [Acidobacteriota bacterium]